jgi:hypothetical protein
MINWHLHGIHKFFTTSRYSVTIQNEANFLTGTRRAMNRLVKVLLAILAVLLIAAAGFVSGSRFGFQQTAVNLPGQAAIAGQSGNPAQGQPDTTGPRSNNTDDDSQDSNRPYGRQNRQGQGMMGQYNRQQSNDCPNHGFDRYSGPQMMPRFNHDYESGGLMGNRQFNGGYRMFPGGGFMSGAFMLFGLLFPLGFGILMVLGIIILYRIVRQPSPAAVAATCPCTKCGASLQSGWGFCPHCGEPIQK